MSTQSSIDALISSPDVSETESGIDELIAPTLLNAEFQQLRTDSPALSEEVSRTLAGQTNEDALSSESGTVSSTLVLFGFQDLTAEIGRGFGDPNNYYSWSLIEFDNQLFVGTFNFEGGEIWRTSLDVTNWEKVLELDPEVEGFRELISYQGRVYAFTTGDGVPTSNLTEPSAYVSSDNGDSWTELDPFPVNNPTNSSIRTSIVHNGLLYMGTFDETGGEIWTYDGGTDGTDGNFNLVKKFSSDIAAVSDFVEFDGQLYAGTFYLSGGANDADPTPRYFWTGENFDVNVTPSFQVPRRFNFRNNEGIVDAAVFQDQVYVSTANLINGFSVFRSSDPLTGDWEIVTRNGFGDRDNAYGWSMAAYDDPSTPVEGDKLFLSNFNTGAYDGNNVLFDGDAQLYTTADGENWGQVALPEEFGPLTYGIRNVVVTSTEQLVLGTAINVTIAEGDDLGTQVWIADL